MASKRKKRACKCSCKKNDRQKVSHSIVDSIKRNVCYFYMLLLMPEKAEAAFHTVMNWEVSGWIIKALARFVM